MKKLLLLCLLALSLRAIAQDELVSGKMNIVPENSGGNIIGQVITTDNQPASFVTIHLKGTNQTTATDENGNFTIKNIKQGIYIVEVSMIGLKPQQQTVTVKENRSSTIIITLLEDAKKLSEVIITSGRGLNNRPLAIGKMPVNPMDLPQSISIIGQGIIREQQSLRLSDVIKNVTGVYLATTRGNVQESFSARGYSFGSNNLFKNGARINSGAMPEMSSLERVEVLKGSAAILFGQVAPGGIVNLVTKEPKFITGGEVSMRVGSYALYKPAVDFYGPLSSAIAYRINGTVEKANSFRDKVSSRRYYINPSLVFKLGNKTELLLESDYLYHKFTPDFGIGSLDNTKIPGVPRSRFMGTPWQYNITQQTTATATLKHRFNDSWKLNTSLSYQLYKRDYYSTERIQAAANGDWARPLGKILAEENYYTGQVNLTGRFSSGTLEHTLLTGIDADHYLTTNNDFSFPPVAGLPAGSYDRINILDPARYVERTDIPAATAIRKRTAPLNRLGAYVQDLVRLSDKFNVLAGVRWSYVSTVGIDSANLLTGAKTKGVTRVDKAFSPRIGMIYKPFNTTSFFASYATSFTGNTGQDVEGRAIAPSIIDQYEIGVKNELLNGLLSANITAYRIVNNNLAETAPFLNDGTPNNNTNIKRLTGQTASDGIEVDLASQPLSGLNITAGYSYTFVRYTKTAVTTGSFKTGERLVNNPAHTANGSVFYTVNHTVFKGLKLGASVFYIGDRFGGWNNTIGQTQTYSRLIPVPGFTTIDLSAGYTFKKISLLAKVSNLSNTLNYYVHENYSINPIAPQQFITTLTYKF